MKINSDKYLIYDSETFKSYGLYDIKLEVDYDDDNSIITEKNFGFSSVNDFISFINTQAKSTSTTNELQLLSDQFTRSFFEYWERNKKFTTTELFYVIREHDLNIIGQAEPAFVVNDKPYVCRSKQLCTRFLSFKDEGERINMFDSILNEFLVMTDKKFDLYLQTFFIAPIVFLPNDNFKKKQAILAKYALVPKYIRNI
jgi:hypothetical protein